MLIRWFVMVGFSVRLDFLIVFWWYDWWWWGCSLCFGLLICFDYCGLGYCCGVCDCLASGFLFVLRFIVVLLLSAWLLCLVCSFFRFGFGFIECCWC